jgi:hypothetical protein
MVEAYTCPKLLHDSVSGVKSKVDSFWNAARPQPDYHGMTRLRYGSACSAGLTEADLSISQSAIDFLMA